MILKHLASELEKVKDRGKELDELVAQYEEVKNIQTVDDLVFLYRLRRGNHALSRSNSFHGLITLQNSYLEVKHAQTEDEEDFV